MKRNRKLFLLIFLVLVVVALPFPLVSQLEERDTFCIACHTAPEEAYYARAQALEPEPVDLSSAHYAVEDAELPFKCIDCHRGDGRLGDRTGR
jgi:nitrate/TMAO reductase-like tetraheme cytochrome c subunit